MGNSLLVGQIALELGLLTKEKLQQGLDLQSSNPNPRQIGTVLVESGLLTPQQFQAVIAEQQRRLKESVPFAPGAKGEMTFGRLLVKGGHVTEEHVNEALRAQQDFAERGQRKRLGELLVEAERLKPEVVLAVLAQQGKALRACTFCGTHFNVLAAVADRFPCRKCGMAMAETTASLSAEDTAYLLPSVPPVEVRPTIPAPPPTTLALPTMPPARPRVQGLNILALLLVVLGVGVVIAVVLSRL
ncbi:MAG TPA: hypothetical protein VEJ18_13045 [Planctomycetota bacterium]|nr:hypothetical protein [Planctomycetota bacterium]